MAHKHHKMKRMAKIIVTISAILLSLLIFSRDLSQVIRVFGTIGLLFFFYLLDKTTDNDFQLKHYIFIMIIAISGIMLSPIYFIWPNYDKILHFTLPILTASIIFYMMKSHNLKLSWRLAFTLFAVVSTLTMFEIVEYTADQTLGWKFQGVYQYETDKWDKNNVIELLGPLDDTIIDISLGIFGTLLYVLFQFLRLRNTNYDGRT